MFISSDLHDTLKNFAAKYASNADFSVVWLIGYYPPQAATPTVTSGIRAIHSLDLLIKEEQTIDNVIPKGLGVVGVFLDSSQVIGAGSEPFLVKFLQQNHQPLKTILYNNKNNNNNNEKRQLVIATAKQSLQVVDNNEIYFYSLDSDFTNESPNLSKIPNDQIQFISTVQLESQIRDTFFLVRISLKLNFEILYRNGDYSQKIKETATPVLNNITPENILLSFKNNIMIRLNDKSKRENVKNVLAPLITSDAKWLGGHAMISLSSSAGPASLSRDEEDIYEHSSSSYELNVLSYISETTTVDVFINDIAKSLHSQAFNLINLSSDDDIQPAPAHFLPPKFPHLVTLSYPFNESIKSQNEDYLISKRIAFHKQLLLPADKPLIRNSNKLIFDNDNYCSFPSAAENPLHSDYRLKDVHLQLQLDEGTATGGTKYLVQGSYLYYHYMQEMNDSGWGCAYRSLQTICSWMVLQGYSNHPIPSINQIQQILVDVKDKEKKFIGSTNWIGSQEVFLCLEHLYGVSSKVLNVSSGADIALKGRELSTHFRNEGTPIMIGGGVLAYTLLGVDFDEASNNIKFLILDPHYVGPENTKNIKDKWCSWKNGDIFRKDSFYNLCMPLRPKKV